LARLPVPAGADDVTPDWLTAALNETGALRGVALPSWSGSARGWSTASPAWSYASFCGTSIRRQGTRITDREGVVRGLAEDAGERRRSGRSNSRDRRLIPPGQFLFDTVARNNLHSLPRHGLARDSSRAAASDTVVRESAVARSAPRPAPAGAAVADGRGARAASHAAPEAAAALVRRAERGCSVATGSYRAPADLP
jgi:hypothetical protein